MTDTAPPTTRRRGLGCLLGCLGVPVLFVALFGGMLGIRYAQLTSNQDAVNETWTGVLNCPPGDAGDACRRDSMAPGLKDSAPTFDALRQRFGPMVAVNPDASSIAMSLSGLQIETEGGVHFMRATWEVEAEVEFELVAHANVNFTLQQGKAGPEITAFSVDPTLVEEPAEERARAAQDFVVRALACEDARCPALDETLLLAERAHFVELLTGDAKETLATREPSSATIVSWSVGRPFEAGDTRPRIAQLQLRTVYGDGKPHLETFTLCERGDALGLLAFEVSEATEPAR